MRRVRVLIADDHRLIVEALRTVLGAHEQIEVVGCTHRSVEVLPLVERLEPDVLLLDVRMPELDGLTCLRRVRRRYPKVQVILLTALASEEVVEPGTAAGAAAVVGKSLDPGLLPEVVVQVAAGERFEPRGFAEPPAQPSHGLSPRETSILLALARGQSNREIAKTLFIAEQTVKFHLTNIYAKLGVANRTAAARFAHEQGLVETPLLTVA